MKRSGPPKRRTPLNPSSKPLARTSMKRTKVERDWTQARAKVERENFCRACKRAAGKDLRLQAAHVIGRENDRPRQRAEHFADELGATYMAVDPTVLMVDPDDIVPLCEPCHTAYDRRELDLLPHLEFVEQVAAVRCAGGIMAALRRLTGSRDLPTGG